MKDITCYLCLVFVLFLQSEVRKTYNMLLRDEGNDFEGFDLDPRSVGECLPHIFSLYYMRFTHTFGVRVCIEARQHVHH